MTTDSPQALRAANRRGVLAMAGGMASFVANDTLVKYVSQSLPSSELIFLRGVFASLLLLAVAHAMGATRQLRSLADRRVVVRALLDSFATVTYLTSLFHLPIANATAINMATPLFITLFAVVAFRERVGAGRWLAIATGFTGVLLVVQPTGAAFNAYALLCLGGTLLHASRDLMTRLIDRRIPSILITFSTALSVTLLAAIWGIFQPWQAPTWQHVGLLAAASVFLSGGYFLLTVSMRAGEMSLIAPFRYTGLLFAVVLGYLVWGDVPNALAWAGVALLVTAGLYILHGGRRPAPEPQAEAVS
ncbi:DMT family transporter [Ramlibacter alkalitolerans]|uniref:DMT family transporter n=1 Tax=Ramlibacter alkalitolerans TaxID=2039631 RepID=A0ABS1JVC9_9BURK|nr:DMT family transporter [Ramlibacter alkalitolerans]MBL0428106.1 DMT family transporter [Ramlibacter alkalitolerans]